MKKVLFAFTAVLMVLLVSCTKKTEDIENMDLSKLDNKTEACYFTTISYTLAGATINTENYYWATEYGVYATLKAGVKTVKALGVGKVDVTCKKDGAKTQEACLQKNTKK